MHDADCEMPFYSMADLPAGRVRVRVRWAGRVFVAARMAPDSRQRDRRLRWAVMEHGEPVYLPRRKDRDDWPPDPECWQPENAAVWIWPPGPVPTPLPVLVRPQMVAQSGRRRWNAMADQAERAAAIRAEALAGLEPEAPAATHPARATRWWLTELPSYSPPGDISVREAEGRVMRAILTDGIRQMELPRGWASSGNTLQDMIAEHVGGEDGPEPFDPSPADVSDYLVAMGWFAALATLAQRPRGRRGFTLSHEQGLIVMHAHGLSWTRISGVIGRSHEHARQAYGATLDRLWHIANGRSIDRHSTTAAARAALKARREAVPA